MNETSNSPWTILRILAGLVSLPFIAFPLWVLRHQMERGFDLLGVVICLTGGTAAFICLWFALRAESADSRAIIAYSMLGGVVLGGISFAAGFFGPMVLTPDSNQGPMLGIFFTGPIGFVSGVIFGAIVGVARIQSKTP